MIVRYEKDPLITLYRSLKDRILQTIACGVVYTTTYKPIDQLTKFILEGNACKIEENAVAVADVIEEDKIILYYVKRAMGNEENPYFDVIHIYGTTYIIIFLDYFEGILNITIEGSEDLESMDMETRAHFNMGNYNYFSAIVTIVALVCDVLQPFRTNNTALAMCDNFRKVPYLIAGRIINQIRKLDLETDVTFLPMEVEEFLHWADETQSSDSEFMVRLLGKKF